MMVCVVYNECELKTILNDTRCDHNVAVRGRR